MRMLLERLHPNGVCTSEEKSVVSATEEKHGRKLYSTWHDPKRIGWPISLDRPETGGELQHVLVAVNWMYIQVSELTSTHAPLWALMENVQ